MYGGHLIYVSSTFFSGGVIVSGHPPRTVDEAYEYPDRCRIVEAPPMLRRFRGQEFAAIIQWMGKQLIDFKDLGEVPKDDQTNY